MMRYFLVVNELSYQRERADKNCKKGKRHNWSVVFKTEEQLDVSDQGVPRIFS